MNYGTMITIYSPKDSETIKFQLQRLQNITVDDSLPLDPSWYLLAHNPLSIVFWFYRIFSVTKIASLSHRGHYPWYYYTYPGLSTEGYESKERYTDKNIP